MTTPARDKILRKFLKTVEGIHLLMGVISGVAILLITLLVVLDVVLRLFFRHPIPGATETSTLLMVTLVYLGLAAVQTQKSNFRMEIMIDNMPPGFRRWINLLTTLIAMAAIGTLSWFTSAEALNSLVSNEMSFGAFRFPVYPARLIIAVGLILLTLQLLIDAIHILIDPPSETT